MPNWCNTIYAVTGDKGEVRDLYNKMKSLSERDTSLVENGFGKTWLGNLVTLLGGDWNKVYCRGDYSMLEIDPDDNCLHFTTVSAWSDLDEVIGFLQGKYPSLEFYFMAEEFGADYWVTNDEGGKYFQDRYFFSPPDYLEADYYTEKQLGILLKDVSKFVGREIDTIEEACKAIDEYNPKDVAGEWAEIRICQIV